MFFHLVWSTKNRIPYLEDARDETINSYISGIAKKEGAEILSIGGMPDHRHLLISMKPTETLARLVKCMKSISTKMIRKRDPEVSCFAWQPGYSVFTVSSSKIDVVKRYIQNQKEHHVDRNFEEECIRLLQKHNIEYDERNLF